MGKRRYLLSLVVVIFFMTTAATCQEQEESINISPTVLKEKMKKGTGVLVDVRRPDEVEKGMIDPSAMHYDFHADDFNENIASLDKKETYYIYCHSGGRSGKTVELMKEMGFKKVYNVDGGITKWQEVGNELVKKE